jgi:hypothetical protein
VGKGFVLGNTQLHQGGSPRAARLPLPPDAHPDAAANPLVQAAEEALDGHQPEVPYPALEVSAKFHAPLCERDTAVASCNLANTRLELGEVLPGHAELAVVALELEAEELYLLKR